MVAMSCLCPVQCAMRQATHSPTPYCTCRYIILYKTFKYVRENFAEEVKVTGGTITSHYKAIIDTYEAEFEAHFVDWETLEPQNVSATARIITKVCNEVRAMPQTKSD